MRSIVALALIIVPSLALAAPAAKPVVPAKSPAPKTVAAPKPAAAPKSGSAPAAGGGLAPSSQHSPPVILDEASALFTLRTRSDEGYDFRAYVEMTGFSSKTDTAHIDLKQNGKVLATAKCGIDRDGAYGIGSCEYGGTPLKVKGELEADLIYWDDQTEKEYLVRTFKMTAYHFKGQWETWQIFPDDVLAAGYAYQGHEFQNDGTYRRVDFYIWFSTGDYLNEGTLRCTVNGTKKLADIPLSPQGGSATGTIEADVQPTNGERVTYRWQKMDLMADVLWGKRSTLQYDMPKTQPKDTVLSDNPGKWECNLRHEGKAIRQLLFTVDNNGMIVQDEIQSGKNSISTVSSRVALIDLRLTKDSATFDKRINPAAMKKSMGFGLPWPTHPKVQAIQASFPAKSGQPDPK
jgi:uncharacterized protein YceK